MNNLLFFQTLPFIQALKQFFENLKVPVSYFDDKPARPQDVLAEQYNLKKEGLDLMDDVYVIGMADDAATTHTKSKIVTTVDAATLKIMMAYYLSQLHLKTVKMDCCQHELILLR